MNSLPKPPNAELRWLSDTANERPDTHAAFRGTFHIAHDAELELRLLGASSYRVWIDGHYLDEGPDRYAAAFPEYQRRSLPLTAGKHVLAIHAHFDGVGTRLLKNMPPFIYGQLFDGSTEILIAWKCLPLPGYDPCCKRINPILSWIEWCDTRPIPANWQQPDFADATWEEPIVVKRDLGEMRPTTIGAVKSLTQSLTLMAHGQLAEIFGYAKDNPAARFFLRDLKGKQHPAQGVWRRYDLRRVYLGRPHFVLDLPAGAVVEFACSEALQHGRVTPWITLSSDDSCNLDHFVARGGVQEFLPLIPKGGRFIEIHILADPAKISFVQEQYRTRSYFGQPEGAFTCNDPLLNQIWSTGIETLRACAEDALIDNPTRERGQWLGDAGAVGMEITAVGYADLRLIRRCLVQSAQSARDDGMVAGLAPGDPAFLSTYAVQWVSAVMNYWKLSGDQSLLTELFPAAVKNFTAFEKFKTEFGIQHEAGWNFIDWGYFRNARDTDVGLSMHYYAALQDFIHWCKVLHRSDLAPKFEIERREFSDFILYYLKNFITAAECDWERIGYHRLVLALKIGFIPVPYIPEAIKFVKKYLLSCFPNNDAAPRLSDPEAGHPQLITPYFAHYAFPLLIENGEMDFVLEQYRQCWGWALAQKLTTWPEVFDTRWSHCHQWSGCPTWQLSRYGLGLHAAFDVGPNHFNFKFYPGSLQQAEGILPLPDGFVAIDWRRTGDQIEYQIEPTVPISIHFLKDQGSMKAGVVEVRQATSWRIPANS